MRLSRSVRIWSTRSPISFRSRRRFRITEIWFEARSFVGVHERSTLRDLLGEPFVFGISEGRHSRHVLAAASDTRPEAQRDRRVGQLDYRVGGGRAVPQLVGVKPTEPTQVDQAFCVDRDAEHDVATEARCAAVSAVSSEPMSG